jgi:hypothetical protein
MDVTITGVDRSGGTVLVVFSDGNIVTYSAKFLYQHRQDDGGEIIRVARSTDENGY